MLPVEPEASPSAGAPQSAPEDARRPRERARRPAAALRDLAEAAASGDAPPGPSRNIAAAVAAAEAALPDPGPPMTGAQMDAFRTAVNQCWELDPGSPGARVIVTAEFKLGRNAKVAGDIHRMKHSGTSDEDATGAFEAARGAIMRCQTGAGYPLPPEKYEQWRRVQLTFDPRSLAAE